MDTHTIATILSNLPSVLTVWTALTLSWGVYIAASYSRMMKHADLHKGGCRPADCTNYKFMNIVNWLLVAYLVLEPTLLNFNGDAIAVVNVFYSAYLMPCTISVGRWLFYKNVKELPPDPTLTSVHN